MLIKANILAHRGWWVNAQQQNTKQGLRRALEAGFGIETDVRDLAGCIVVSHDPPHPQKVELDLETLADLYRQIGCAGVMALNIKSDGLAEAVRQILHRHLIYNYFVFDMSVPDMRHYLRRDMHVFARWSEYEHSSSLDDRANGLWLDCFEGEFVSESTFANGLDLRKRVALVSPELHSRPHQTAWKAWRNVLRDRKDIWGNVLVCTDFPDAAFDFFQAD
jgi:hypothetical protein